MKCPFIRIPTFDGFEDFECTAVERLEDPNDKFGCEDCCHYQAIQKHDDLRPCNDERKDRG